MKSTEQQTTGNRNTTLDMYKAIACILVVHIHCPFPGALGNNIKVLSRWAVPFFFMVSGYFAFYENINGEKAILNKIKHIAGLAFYSSLFYLLVAGIHYFLGWSGYSYSINAKNIVLYWIYGNEPIIIAKQMWFIFALLYVYLIFGLFHKIKKITWLKYSLPILFAGYEFMTNGLYYLGKKKLKNCLYRNWLFVGIPYFLIGYMLRENKDKLKKIKNIWLILLLSLSTVGTLAEVSIRGRDFGINICTIPQVINLITY